MQLPRLLPPELLPAPVPVRVERRCAGCGYGAYVQPHDPAPCPMCRALAWRAPRELTPRGGS